MKESAAGCRFATMGRNPPEFARQATLAVGLVFLAGLAAGCGLAVEPGRTHHRLYSWNCPSTPDKKAFLVLRYHDKWVDASKTTRVGLIKFQTKPEPVILEDRYVWGIPTGESRYVLFDAMRNRTILWTDYVRQVPLSADGGLLAFAREEDGPIELVRPDGRVVVPADAGFAEVRLAFARQDGSAVLALARPDGQWHLLDDEGAAVTGAEALTTLDLSPLPTP